MTAVFVHGVPETPPSGTGCWLRWITPTRWPCRSPGSTAPAVLREFWATPAW